MSDTYWHDRIEASDGGAARTDADALLVRLNQGRRFARSRPPKPLWMSCRMSHSNALLEVARLNEERRFARNRLTKPVQSVCQECPIHVGMTAIEASKSAARLEVTGAEALLGVVPMKLKRRNRPTHVGTACIGALKEGRRAGSEPV
ncbi:unnamed protein product [Strongylus vulgaris]|uniref:Uncharacterized protein n=1 Tax=Strongylus vulgaris TaxID=40348 RepID=A0A3P7JHT5_STRVU|nr:unnamed protein product [Strongylus vulgaris]